MQGRASHDLCVQWQVHVLALALQVRDAGNLLTRAGFAIPSVDTDDIVVHYNDPLQLVQHIRCMWPQQQRLASHDMKAYMQVSEQASMWFHFCLVSNMRMCFACRFQASLHQPSSSLAGSGADHVKLFLAAQLMPPFFSQQQSDDSASLLGLSYLSGICLLHMSISVIDCAGLGS